MYKDVQTVSSFVTDLTAIKNSIKNILLTPRGTLPGKPRFGSDLYRVIFSPLDYLTEAMARNFIQEALSEFEDRVIINDIQFRQVEEYNKLIIDIAFQYRNYVSSTNTYIEDTSLSISINL